MVPLPVRPGQGAGTEVGMPAGLGIAAIFYKTMGLLYQVWGRRKRNHANAHI